MQLESNSPNIEGCRSLPRAEACKPNFRCTWPMGMIQQPTSAFMISTDLSFPCELNRSTSGPLLSKVHTETRLLVTLCDPDCTFHSPI